MTGCHNFESISQCNTVILDMCANHRNHQIDWIARKCDWCDGRIWNELMSQSKVDRVAPHHGRLTTPLPIHRFSKLRTQEVRHWKGSTPGSLLARGGRYYRKKLATVDISAFSQLIGKLSLSEKIDLGIIEKLSLSKICSWFHPINTVPKTRARDCFIYRTNINLSLKTVQKVQWQYLPNILYCKICPFLP